MTTKIDLNKIGVETLLLKMLLRAFEKLLMVPGVEVLSPGGSPDGIGDIELMEHVYKEIAKEIEADLEAARVIGG